MLSKIFTVAVLSAVSAAYAQTAPSPLSFRTVKLEAKSCQGKDRENKPICHESEVAYPVTGDRHLDHWVKQQFHGSLPTQSAVQSELNRNSEVKRINQSNRQALREDGHLCRLMFVNTLNLEGYTANYAVFGKESWQYSCGTHGSGSHGLTVLKRGTPNPKPLTLNDILLPNQRDKLTQLLKEAYVKYLMVKGDSEEEARENMSSWSSSSRYGNFKATDNWRFDKNGLTFLYQSYEIGAYGVGRPELTISAEDLQGVIKPEILQEIGHYRKNPVILQNPEIE